MPFLAFQARRRTAMGKVARMVAARLPRPCLLVTTKRTALAWHRCPQVATLLFPAHQALMITLVVVLLLTPLARILGLALTSVVACAVQSLGCLLPLQLAAARRLASQAILDTRRVFGLTVKALMLILMVVGALAQKCLWALRRLPSRRVCLTRDTRPPMLIDGQAPSKNILARCTAFQVDSAMFRKPKLEASFCRCVSVCLCLRACVCSLCDACSTNSPTVVQKRLPTSWTTCYLTCPP
jgi:hypothetical protein